MSRRYQEGQAASFHSKTAADLYQVAYFETLDLAISAINKRFDQPGYAMCRNLEELLQKKFCGNNYADELRQVTDLYQELDCSVFEVDLKSLATHFKGTTSITLEVCIKYLRSLSSRAKHFFGKVSHVVQLLLEMPATSAVSERSFSTMRRIKLYLRSTMWQDLL